MTDNMQIWDAVSETDPDHTKRVNQRGGFTAIDAHYQIMMATKTFGPVGVGWGYETSDPIFTGPFIIVPVTIWHGDRSNTYGPILGCAEIAGNRPDSDAPKKATTDAITKGLSQLGFNADVHLGKFDDNKYVESLKAKKAESDPRDPRKVADSLIAVVREAKNYGHINEIIGGQKFDAAWKWLDEEHKPMGLEVKKAVAEMRDQFDPSRQAPDERAA